MIIDAEKNEIWDSNSRERRIAKNPKNRENNNNCNNHN